MSTGNSDSSASLKAQALRAIENIKTKNDDFLQDCNTVVHTLTEVITGTGDGHTPSALKDAFNAAVDKMVQIGGKSALVLDLVS